MPWRTESVMDQRVEFVLRAREGEERWRSYVASMESAGRPVIYG